MADTKAVLAIVVIITVPTLLLVVPQFLPSPWNFVLTLVDMAVLYLMCYSGGRSPPRMHLPRTYYVLALVAVGAIAVTAILARLLGEAAWWLTALFAFEFALSLPLFLYIALAFILPESASGVKSTGGE